MAPIPGAVVVTGFLGPSDSADTYAVTDETYNKGGYRTVANIGGRTGISADRRTVGMMVYQVDTLHYWQLQGGITDGHWVDLGLWPVVPPGSGIPGYNGTGVDDPNPGASTYNLSDQEDWQTVWSWTAINDKDATWTWDTQGMIRWVGSYTGTDPELIRIKPYLAYGPIDSQGPPSYMQFAINPSIAADPSSYNAIQFQKLGVQCPAAGDFLASAMNIGWGADTIDSTGCESIVFVKDTGDNKLYAQINRIAGGGQTHREDTGVLLANGDVHKYAIVFGINFAEYYVDEVKVYTMTSGHAGFWPVTTGLRPVGGNFDFHDLGNGKACYVKYAVPFITGVCYATL